MELDHLFIFTAKPGQAADALRRFGLTEGAPNTHPGQGTACRRFFFRNAYLELMWVSSDEEIKSPAIAETRLWERSRYTQTGYCPFGLCFRNRSTHNTSSLIFEDGWHYKPPYLPGDTYVNIAANPDLPAEPLLFEIPLFGIAPKVYPPGRQPPLQHEKGFREITQVTLKLPTTLAQLSAPMQKVISHSPVAVAEGTDYWVEVELDRGKKGKVQDFTHLLPLTIRW